MSQVEFRSRRSLMVLGAAAAALIAGAAQAQAVHKVAVGGGGLDAALLSLAAQTDQKIFFQNGLVAEIKAPRVAGELTVDQALARLLAGTGLRARRVTSGLIIVERTTSAAPEKAMAVGPSEGVGRTSERELITAGAAPASHETAPPASAPALLEEVTVTGSNIRGAPSPSPLVTVTRADLERSGRTTVVSALRLLPQVFSGGAGEGASINGADPLQRNGTAATALNLRGLGANATLVLINGRRMAGSGTFGDFADVSAIPTAAVDRVEVLLDGASAVYGADAVGGVVNIILRRDYDGAETRLLAGAATKGEPLEGQVSHTFGHRWSEGGMLMSFELQRRDALPSEARDFTASADLRALGGTDLRQVNAAPGNILRTDPATGATVPGWAIPSGQNGVGLRPNDLLAGAVNLRNGRAGIYTLPKQTLQSVYLAADQALSDRFKVSGDVRFSSRRFKNQLAAPTSNLVVNRSNPFFVSPNGSASHTISYAFDNDLPPQSQSGTTENLGVTFGGDYRLKGDWRAEAYATYAQEIGEARNGRLLNSLALNEALGTIADRPDTPFSAARDGYFNPFVGIAGANNPTVLAFIGSGFTNIRYTGKVASASLQLDGTVWQLPGGPLKLAAGAQARRETLQRSGSSFQSTVAPVPSSSFDASRDVAAAFAELRAPLFGADNRRAGLERLELSLAARVEHYEAVGTTTNPKAGVLWSPAEGVLVRATYGRSFRAPSLREVRDPESSNPSLFPLGAVRVRTLLLNGGNPDLKPETAHSWTFGVDLRPSRLPGLSLSATGFDIRFRNRIDQPVIRNIVGALSDPNLSAFVTRISPTNPADVAKVAALLAKPTHNSSNGVFAPEDYGGIIDNRYVNTSTLQVRGIDFAGSYRFDLGDDQVVLGATATYTLDFEEQVTPTAKVVDRAGIANYPVKFRGRATADWTRDRLTLSGAVNYIDRYRSPLGDRIDSQLTVDLQARLEGPDHGPWRGVALTLNARNVFDTDPPFYNNVGPNIGYDAAVADPIGRYVSIQLTKTW
ncbi:MAG: hypothetical protein A2790_20180 [Phenylobacterium sp. RIFCSPHIGHO2_01_FULL_69_31]|uniref:TonB-dependent receptor n=1 Tax=Phenylobacterium sp. RIFCSPHIGHO2_01_FULL_69_31 TaxID=1801944 RepID=UPI0008AF6023|nr:TonB-dependent receptor [Phenylobacterium sp. RIFCSPHIGHO2_01_FULL_69_31]OHB26284.1 MAG: hypothetical protein A2790_20180 [Phenylobacterium sp. RIFCSPHIGHO2_01_FULL_69_31]